ncbi:hypothetical protein JTB14_035584 [Gonioctena quinquepunctata]|nr:hypothetical protein JTB14_035584 [Gonioctena quinquepunctata]
MGYIPTLDIPIPSSLGGLISAHLKIADILCVIYCISVESCGDFYWRDYNGRIPIDAIPAGNSSNGLSYIGQAYIHHYGLLLGTITPNYMEIKVPCYGVVVTNIMIRILCAQNHSRFHWVPTSLETFKRDMKEQCPVLGGYDRKAGEMRGSKGTLNIGRTRKFGDVIIGNIAAYDEREVWFYYPLDGGENRASSYEVLVYRGDTTIDKESSFGRQFFEE